MHKLTDLCYMLEDEIGRVTQKGDISPSELENVYKAVKTMYYIKVIKAMDEFDDGYSGKRMMISYDGRPEFEHENSYGYYTRGRDSMGRYSREGEHHDKKEEMRRHLEMAMNMADSEVERQNLRDMLNKL